MYSVLNTLSEYKYFYIKKHYFIHLCCLFLKSSKAFSVSLESFLKKRSCISINYFTWSRQNSVRDGGLTQYANCFEQICSLALIPVLFLIIFYGNTEAHTLNFSIMVQNSQIQPFYWNWHRSSESYFTKFVIGVPSVFQFLNTFLALCSLVVYGQGLSSA